MTESNKTPSTTDKQLLYRYEILSTYQDVRWNFPNSKFEIVEWKLFLSNNNGLFCLFNGLFMTSTFKDNF